MLMMQDRKRCRSFRSALADSTMAARIARTENSAHSFPGQLLLATTIIGAGCALGHRFSLASLTMKQASLSSSIVQGGGKRRGEGIFSATEKPENAPNYCARSGGGKSLATASSAMKT